MSDVVRRLRHRIGTEPGLYLRVGKACSEGAVVDMEVTGPGACRLGHHEWRPTHALHAARNKQLAFAAAHGAGSIQYSRQARAAETIDGQTANGRRQAGQQRNMARQVAPVLTGLAAAAGDQVFIVAHLKRVTRHQRAHHRGQQVIGTHTGQRATVATEG